MTAQTHPRATAPCSDSAGLTLTELLVALALASTGLAALAALSSAVLAAFDADPAAAEQQQRGRATLAVLAADVARAGPGGAHAAGTPPGATTPAVMPDMLRAGPWSVGAHPSTLATIAAARTAAHARLATAVTAGESRLIVERPGFCSPASPTCRFAAGDDVLLAGPHGAFALASVRAASPPLVLDLAAPLAQGWPAGTGVSVVTARGYALRPDAATGLQQIVRAHGPGPATALVDFVERFDVEWLLDGAAPSVRVAPDDTLEFASAGPLPPVAGEIGDPAWPAGENCLFARDAAGRIVSRLAPLGAGAVAVPLGRLADGPWCPSPAAPSRWDADLARVVGVRVRLDIAVASALLRLPTLAAPGDGSRARFRSVPRLTLTTVLAPGRAAGTP
jgi:hypothetical protein